MVLFAAFFFFARFLLFLLLDIEILATSANQFYVISGFWGSLHRIRYYFCVGQLYNSRDYLIFFAGW